MTFSAPTFVSCVRMSSWMPSTKKASSASRLRFSKGRTAIEGRASVKVGGRRCGRLCVAAGLVAVPLRCVARSTRTPRRRAAGAA